MDDSTVKQLQQLLAALGGNDSASSSKRHVNELPDYVLVAAIDFGTTFSGYAFSFKTSKSEIRMNKNWGAEIGATTYKTPTCLLCDPDKKFVAFGYGAQHKYAEMVEQDDKKYYFFERFKMKLHGQKHLNDKTEVQAANGKSMPALDVFSMSLEFLKNHLIDAISQVTAGSVETDMIRWVITVPAIWSDASKQFMRQAAFKAGMIETEDSKKLVIALEPEAASLYVRKLDIDKFHSVSANTTKMPVGTKYLVVDAGGGTLDVTAHELVENNKIKELHYASGGPLGGTNVDEQFVELMRKIFGEDFIEYFKKESASQWLQMVSDFEKKKRQVKQNGSLNMNLPWDFGQKYQEKKGDVGKAIQTYNNPDIKFANGMFSIKPSVVNELFQPVIDGIVAHIMALLDIPKLKEVRYIFCVGGFSESELLQGAMTSNFRGRAVVLVPEEASLAVVKGAVEFGHRTDAISSRIAAKTYGVETWSSFLPIIHKQEKLFHLEGKAYCKDLFDVYVKKGDEVPVGYSHSSNFSPVRDEQDAAEVSLYSVDRPDVQYVTDNGVEHHGDIKVQWPGKGKNRQLDVTMVFGGTEIDVYAITQPGGNKAETKINFLMD